MKVSGSFFGGIHVNQSPHGLKPILVRDPYAASDSRLFTACQNLERESSFPSK